GAPTSAPGSVGARCGPGEGSGRHTWGCPAHPTEDGDPMATATRRTAALLAASVLALTACSGGDPETEQETSDAPSAADRLEQARTVLTDAGSVALTLTGSDLPDDVSSLVIAAEGSGTMEPAAFEGTITAKVQGIQADVPTVAVEDQLYVKLPFP